MSAVKRDGVTLGSYQYDPFGRRVKKVTSAGAVYFHYDDTGLLAEYDASGQLTSEYQYQPGNHWMTHPLFKRDGATGKVHYYYNSHLGQPLKLFDKAGRTTWSARSQAFGETDVVENETDNPLRFPGQYEDGETGLLHNYMRDYDPSGGRYIQRDPIGIDGGLNEYIYAYSNSANYVDPTGELVPALLGAAIGMGLEYLTNPCASAGDILLAGAIGGAGGLLSGKAFLRFGPKARTRDTGKEWSPAIPRRVVNMLPKGGLRSALNKRGGLNGSWASPKRHFKHDPSRYPKGYKDMGRRFPAPIAMLDRVPDWAKGSIASGSLGAGASGAGGGSGGADEAGASCGLGDSARECQL